MGFVSRSFRFRDLSLEENDYVFECEFDDERVLSLYNLKKNHGLFTEKKLALYDVECTLKKGAEVHIFPLDTISNITKSCKEDVFVISLFFKDEKTMSLKFVDVSFVDRIKLRKVCRIIEKVVNS